MEGEEDSENMSNGLREIERENPDFSMKNSEKQN